jgi:arsenate reductase
MAEALFNHIAGRKACAFSAGTRPASHTDRRVVEAMKELGIDISHQRPKLLTFEMLENADRVITMGCNVAEACPASSAPTEDWELDDPEGKPIEEVRQIRDKTKARVQELLERLL